MDWLKRNWVDVLMAGLILAVVGGFLTLLLRGGVFVSKPADTSNTPNTNTLITVPAPNTPNAPTTIPSSPPVAAVIPTPSTPKPDVQATTPLDVPDIPEAPATLPASGTTTTGGSAVGTAPTNSSNTATRPTAAIVTTPAVVAAKTPTPSNQKTTPEATKPPSTNNSYARADFLRNYRVAAGSYSSLERAKKAVIQLRGGGLPAQTFPSGNSHVVVVGPYAREASARTALTRVRQSFPDAILYRPDGTREAVARVVVPPAGGGTGAPATLTAESAYLQVGAFKDIKGATALLEKLQNAGFKPLTKNISGLLRVLVGPFGSSQLETTRTDLKNSGFDAFPINL